MPTRFGNKVNELGRAVSTAVGSEIAEGTFEAGAIMAETGSSILETIESFETAKENVRRIETISDEIRSYTFGQHFTISNILNRLQRVIYEGPVAKYTDIQAALWPETIAKEITAFNQELLGVGFDLVIALLRIVRDTTSTS